jgi:hypothetical protein
LYKYETLLPSEKNIQSVPYVQHHRKKIKKGKTKAFIYITCSICPPLFSVHKAGFFIDMFIEKDGAYDAILPNATPHHPCSFESVYQCGLS